MQWHLLSLIRSMHAVDAHDCRACALIDAHELCI